MTMQREFDIFKETLSSHLSKDPNECACHGSGWISSPFDTWHKCRVHWDQHPHPEYDEEVAFYCTFESHEAYKAHLAEQRRNPPPPFKISPCVVLPDNDPDEGCPF